MTAPRYLHLFAWFEIRKQGGIDEPVWVVETFESEEVEMTPDECSVASETIELWCSRILITQPGELQMFLQGEEPGEYANVVIPLPLANPLCFFEVHADPWVITGRETVE